MEMGLSGKKILLVGACGMGLGPLGIYLSRQGHEVYGFDDYPNAVQIERLKKAGISWLDYLPADLSFDEIIFTRAIDSNPDWLASIQQKYSSAKVSYRGEYLSEIALNKKAIVIAGSHGKTTTTSNLIQLLQHYSFDFSYILGGFHASDEPSAAHYSESSEWIVMEVDESDRTIELFCPELTAITNIDLDHVGTYSNEKDLILTFKGLTDNTKDLVFLSTATFKQLSTSLDDRFLCLDASHLDTFDQLNWMFAENVAAYLGCKAVPELRQVSRVERRQDVYTFSDDRILLQDYAHHPTELLSLLSWCEKYYPDCPIKVVFQPHRYTRTRALMKEFAMVLSKVNCYLIPEYGAFESVDDKSSSMALFKMIKEVSTEAAIHYSGTPELLVDELGLGEMKRELVLMVGAGDISLWTEWIQLQLAQPKFDFEQLWISHLSDRFDDGSYFNCYEDLKRKVTLNVGGVAKYYAEPNSLSSLQHLLKLSKLLGIKSEIIGKGSNLLVDDRLFDGLIIRLNRSYWKYYSLQGSHHYYVRAGCLLKEISRHALIHAIGGFNFWEGIPGTIGGAIRMNAGAMGDETSSRIVEVECLNRDGKMIRFKRNHLNFVYRRCESVDDLIVVGATLGGIPHQKVETLEAELMKFRSRRLSSQPIEPSAGCMFRNPEGDSAGRLIDVAGLKGFKIGGARVSEKHANFLVTERGASAGDVTALLQHVCECVQEIHGVELEQEIEVFES